jgi:mannose-6-phosphate isomerase
VTRPDDAPDRTRPDSPRPVLLGPNQPIRRPYRGGAGIARLRGLEHVRDDVPEDFVGSTTEVASGGGVGLTVMPDGRTLREHIRFDPEAYLGPRHVAAFGAEPALLVKVLDTAQRLFVHFHPDDAFANRHLGSRFGKTEAWYVIDGVGEAFLGFDREVDPDEVASWVARQDVDAMLSALNRIPVRPGDSLLVPGGVPHAIGAGITLVELQEPTDFSILLEWTGYPIGPEDGHLGLGFDTALTALDRSRWDADRLAALSGRRASLAGVSQLFPPDADPFFRAEHVVAPAVFPAAYSLLVVLAGQGELLCDLDTLPLRRGSVVLVPYAAGDIELTGTLQAVRCLPPDPSSVAGQH